jgi:isoleucyl-tRNA synthetase
MLLKIRSEVNKHLENSRKSDIIGSALEAEVDVYCSNEIKEILSKFKEELRFIFITSEANIFDLDHHGAETEIEGLRVRIRKTNHNKCERCWHSRVDVGLSEVHSSICGRCIENVDGAGEKRFYA